MRGRSLPIWLLVGTLTACTYVKLTPGGESVRTLRPEQAAACERIGRSTAQVKDRFVFKRNQEKVESELEALARNRAAAMGGNAIAPEGPVAEGSRSYGVYRCPSP